MRTKAIICNCKGLSPTFKNSDMNTLPFDIETGLDVDYAVVHPQLCGMGGNRLIEDALRSAEEDPETIVIVGACEPDAQLELFQKLFCKTGFDPDHFLPVDIRGATNSEILERLGEKLREHAQPREKRH
jgi:heterodisulfide reductase subunit A-like polyferredoxin